MICKGSYAELEITEKNGDKIYVRGTTCSDNRLNEDAYIIYGKNLLIKGKLVRAFQSCDSEQEKESKDIEVIRIM